jgi:hypothetical protein
VVGVCSGNALGAHPRPLRERVVFRVQRKTG